MLFISLLVSLPLEPRLQYGLDDMCVRASRVEACIAEASEIIEAYDDVQQKALTELCGKVYDSESSEENGGNSEIELEYGDEEAYASPYLMYGPV